MASRDGHSDLGRTFAAVARRHGDLPALRLAGGDVSYAAMDALSNRLARWLVGRGVVQGSVVALQNGKTAIGYSAMLACLKLGVAYVNLDVQNPADRLRRILDSCRPALILADEVPAESLAGIRNAGICPVADLREHIDAIAQLDASPVGSAAAGDAAYIMFTSGSTGEPKGAVIAQASVLNFIAWTRATFGIGPGDVVGNVNPMYFDNSVFDFYSALFNGACLAPVTAAQMADPRAMVRRIDDAGCTIWFSVPSLLIYLMTMKALTAESFRRIRTIVFGGEGYPKTELSKLFSLYSGRSRFVNVYGPTECTCICSAYDVTAADFHEMAGVPPLGRIADLFSYRVLDGATPVAPGDVGELCLMGPQLAIGYCNDDERTAAAFTLSPASLGPPQRMYRTGDLVREAGGLLHFVGRKDNQVKHMGYRIELEEIESALQRLDYVIQAGAIYHRVHAGFGHIVAYVATGDAAVDEARLRADLNALLPSYMIPNRFVLARELPKNANGKIDRARLNELSKDRAS